nr:MAG TPA: hypothetical protein [Caudoviricetes sp.]
MGYIHYKELGKFKKGRSLSDRPFLYRYTRARVHKAN